MEFLNLHFVNTVEGGIPQVTGSCQKSKVIKGQKAFVVLQPEHRHYNNSCFPLSVNYLINCDVIHSFIYQLDRVSLLCYCNCVIINFHFLILINTILCLNHPKTFKPPVHSLCSIKRQKSQYVIYILHSFLISFEKLSLEHKFTI